MKNPIIRRVIKRRMAGLSLIELMVALTISAVLIFGATQVYVDSRAAYNVNETVARLQENARYAMSVLEPDIRMSNYWGLVKGASLVSSQATQAAATSAVASNAEANYCGNNFAVDLNTTLQGDNNIYTLSGTRTGSCDTVLGTGWATSASLSSDTLTVRRASAVRSVDGTGQPLSLANTLQICSTRLAARLYSDNSVCGTAPANQVNNLIVNAYYVDNASSVGATTPSLRRKALQTVSSKPRFIDQEIIYGVEDMQVQFGIDASGITGVATRYVNPDAVPAGAAVVAVRVWLLVRSETPEPGFIDNRIYAYGDRLQATGVISNLNAVASRAKAYQPSLDTSTLPTSVKHFRRILVCRTFMIRNSLGT